MQRSCVRSCTRRSFHCGPSSRRGKVIMQSKSLTRRSCARVGRLLTSPSAANPDRYWPLHHDQGGGPPEANVSCGLVCFPDHRHLIRNVMRTAVSCGCALCLTHVSCTARAARGRRHVSEFGVSGLSLSAVCCITELCLSESSIGNS